MLMYGVVWVSLIWMYRTEIRAMDVVSGHPHKVPAAVAGAE